MTREEKERAITNNIICFIKLDDIKHAVVNNGADVYSEVASEIFHCSSDECREFHSDESGNLVKYADGKKRRDVAKYLMLNRMMLDDIASKFEVYDLADRIISAFPYTPIDELESDDPDIEIGREDAAINAYSFITLIRGYCILPYYQKKFNKFKEIFWNSVQQSY